ncbi:MAG TPA: methyl-accepting chemotaxis protein, partial [Clostridia bacterium]|nr:methyl-accepting chemotaxis protein [Clostridia bacterium]
LKEVANIAMPSLQALLTMSEQAGIIKASQRTLLNPDIELSIRQRQTGLVANAKETYETAWKTYDQIPKDAEEDALWKQVQSAWMAWKSDNDEFFRMANELDTLKIGNPAKLGQDLARFRGDHYKLEKQILNMCDSKQVFEGGEDHTACGFGKWKAAQKIENPEMVKLLAEISTSHQKFHEAVKATKEMIKAGNVESARQTYKKEVEPQAEETIARFDQMLKVAANATNLGDKLNNQALVVCRASQLKVEESLEKLEQRIRDKSATECREATSLGVFFQKLSLFSIVLGVTVGITLAWSLTRSITRPIKTLAEVLSTGADQTVAAAGQVSAASQSLAEGASEQAASLEETSASLEEMSSMTKRNTEHAEKVNALARQARGAADTGAADMQAMASAMNQIKTSTDDIAKIIKTIDEIAFQTNILALNAAVEAARAGEAGMGFAVVADEVRNLAQRAAQSAKETASMIESAVTKTAQGVEITDKVSKSLQEIVVKARQVDELAAEVASASKEQAQGIQQVNTVMTQMDKVTQSNAASAEESASAAEELNGQAESLKEAVTGLLQLVNGYSASQSSAAKSPSLKSQPARVRSNGQAKNWEQMSFRRPAPAPAKDIRQEIPLEAEFKDF